jgi:alkylation response protein AidB-like acyl-CoA dehydrogenase
MAPELEELGDRIEDTGKVPERVWQLLIEGGFLRMTLPEKWGGFGMPFTECAKVLEKVAGFHSAVRMFVHGMNGLWRPMFNFGTEDQKARWLPVFRQGRFFAFSLTESETGSGRDVGTTAALEGGEWVVNGKKNLISFAADAEVHYVVARTGTDRDGVPEISCILVPKGTPGMTIVPLPEGMGCKGTAHDAVVYENCRVPAANLLGKRGEGLEVGIRGFLDPSRLGIATSCLGVAQRSFELACDFAKKRVTFGKPIAQRQAIQMQVGEMAAELYSLRAAIRDAAARFDQGLPIVTEAAMCKLLGIEILGRVTDRALRIHGGIGYTRAYRVERLYRDGRAMWFEEGTAEIQKQTICRAYLKSAK